MKDRILFIIYGSYLVDMAFNLVPPTWEGNYFLLFDGYYLADGSYWDGSMPFQTFVHKACGHVATMMRFWAFWEAVKKRELLVIFWLEFLDLIDFWVIYNDRWFWLPLQNGGQYSVEFNDVIFILMAILIIQTVCRKQEQLS